MNSQGHVGTALPAVVLACERLKKIFHDGHLSATVLSGVYLQVNTAEKIAIMGASGSGKSTLLHLLGGLEVPTEGEVYIAGDRMTGMKEDARSRLRQRHLGFVYQFHHLLPEFSVLENVCLPLLLRKTLLIKSVKEKAAHLLASVGLSHRMHHRMGEISGGERQRAAIARALVTDPVCVLADEPTGNLDEKTAGHIHDLMLALNERLGTSFIIATHDVKLARKMQRIFVLEQGILRETSEIQTSKTLS